MSEQVVFLDFHRAKEKILSCIPQLSIIYSVQLSMYTTLDDIFVSGRQCSKFSPLMMPRLANFPSSNCQMFDFELKDDSMADKERIDLEELQVQTSDMYISDNLIGEPITNSTNSLSTEVSEKTVPENQMTVNEDSVSKDVTEEEMVAVECEAEQTDNSVQMDDNDGIRVTGSDEGEFVLLNANDHVVVPGSYLQISSVIFVIFHVFFNRLSYLDRIY